MITINLNKDTKDFILRRSTNEIKLSQVGKRGAQGADGDPGEAATIEVGTVTTVEPDQPASVTNVGTEQEAVFDFEIPRGEDGGAGSSMAIGESVVDAQPNRLLATDENGDLTDEYFDVEKVELELSPEITLGGNTLRPAEFNGEGVSFGGIDLSAVGIGKTFGLFTVPGEKGSFALAEVDPNGTTPPVAYFVMGTDEFGQLQLQIAPNGLGQPGFNFSINEDGLILSDSSPETEIRNISVDPTLSGDSDSTLSTQKAVKAYVDAQIVPPPEEYEPPMILAPERATHYPSAGTSEARWITDALEFTNSADIRVTFRPELPTWDKTDDLWAELFTQTRDDGFGANDNFEVALLWSNGGFGRIEDKPYIYWEWTKAGETTETSSFTVDADLKPGEWASIRVTQDFDTGTISIYRQVDWEGDVTTDDGKHWQLVDSVVNPDAASIANDSNVPGTWPTGEPWAVGYRMQGDISSVQAYDGIDENILVDWSPSELTPNEVEFTDLEGNEWATNIGSIIAIDKEAGEGLTETNGVFDLNATQDDIPDGTTYKQFSASEKTKLSHIAVTQAVDLDAMESSLASLDLKANAANAKGFVNHGSTAGTTRPSGYASIEWYGSVEPTNMQNGDTWIKT